MADCEQFLEGSRKRAICEGRASLPLDSINLLRARWGVGPLSRAERTAIREAVSPSAPSFPSHRRTTTPSSIGGCCSHDRAADAHATPFDPTRYPPVKVTQADVAERCQLIVKSFRRFRALASFLRSVKEHYPGLEVLIADDSLDHEESYPESVNDIRALPDVRWFEMPFDSGLSAGRNLLVRNATKDILILCDDDYILRDDTRLERLVAVLDARSDISLVAGLVQEPGQAPKNWTGKFVWKQSADGNSLHVQPLASQWEMAGGVECRTADVVLNFFAARRDSLLRHPWDDQLKIASEHKDFFLTRFHGGEVSVYTTEVIVLHVPERPSNYATYRWRTKPYYDLMKSKWKLKHFQPLAQTIERPQRHIPEKPATRALPHLARQAVNYSKAIARHLADGRSKLPVVDSQIRVAVCQSCSWFRNEDRRCAHPGCGCFIDEKATWRSEDCPESKWPVDTRPNVVVLGVGHSGTTILTQMLLKLGWNGGNIDKEFAELRAVFGINDTVLRTGSFDESAARRLLGRLPSPWVIKDPRFCETLGLWRTVMQPHHPLLVWLVREQEALEASYARRHEPEIVRGFTRSENLAHAATAFKEWPWAKVKVSLDQISAAVTLFDLDRVQSQHTTLESSKES